MLWAVYARYAGEDLAHRHIFESIDDARDYVDYLLTCAEPLHLQGIVVKEVDV